MSNLETDKYISYILRHKPEDAGITLDEHGWANVDELISAVNKTHPLTPELLGQFVNASDKKRYSFNEDKTLIRANHGHSVPIDIDLPELAPPEFLYHGTGEKFEAAIGKEGLISKSRLYVHLSIDKDKALKVAVRHGKPVLYQVLSNKMYNEGYKFYKSVSDIWLTKKVPLEFLEKLPDNK